MNTDPTPPSTKNPHPIDVLPPAMHGSAADLPPSPIDALAPDHATPFDGETPWWRPGFPEIVKAIGWKWLIVIPAALFALGMPAFWFYQLATHTGATGTFTGSFKLVIFAIGIIVTVVLGAIKRGVATRSDPFCIHCGYSLLGLPENGSCPECGRPYVGSVIQEFRKDPHFFAMRHAILRRAPRHEPFAAADGPTPDDGTR